MQYTSARAGLHSIAYHLGTLGVATGLAATGILPAYGPAALVPGAARAVWAVLRPHPERTVIRRVGYGEVVHALIFAALSIAIFRVPHFVR